MSSKPTRLEKAEEQLEDNRAAGRWFDALRLLDWYTQSAAAWTPTKAHPTPESVTAYRHTILAEIAFYTLDKRKRDRVMEAKGHLEEAIKADPSYVDARILLAVVELEVKELSTEEKSGIALLLEALGPVQSRLEEQAQLLSEHRVHLRLLGATFLVDALVTAERYEEALAVCRSAWAVIWYFFARKGVEFPAFFRPLLPCGDGVLSSASGHSQRTPAKKQQSWSSCWERLHSQTQTLAAHRAADIAILSMALKQYKECVSACRACLGTKSPLPLLLGKDKSDTVVTVFHQALCKRGSAPCARPHWVMRNKAEVAHAEAGTHDLFFSEFDPLLLEWKWSHRGVWRKHAANAELPHPCFGVEAAALETAANQEKKAASSETEKQGSSKGTGAQEDSETKGTDGEEQTSTETHSKRESQGHGSSDNVAYVGGILQLLHAGLELKGITTVDLDVVIQDLRMMLLHANSSLQRYALLVTLSIAEARAGHLSLSCQTLQQASKHSYSELGLRTLLCQVEGGKSLLSSPELEAPVESTYNDALVDELHNLGLVTAEEAILAGDVPVVPLHVAHRVAAIVALRYVRNAAAAVTHCQAAVEEARHLYQMARRVISTHNFREDIALPSAVKTAVATALTGSLLYSLELLGVSVLLLSRAGGAHTDSAAQRLRAIQCFRRCVHIQSAFRSAVADIGDLDDTNSSDAEPIGVALSMCNDWQLCYHLALSLCDASEYEEALRVIRHTLKLSGADRCSAVWCIASIATYIVSGARDAFKVVVSGLDALPDSPLLFWVSAEISEELVASDTDLTVRMESGDLTLSPSVVLRWFASAAAALSRDIEAPAPASSSSKAGATQEAAAADATRGPASKEPQLQQTDIARILRRSLAGLEVPERAAVSTLSRSAPKPQYRAEPRPDIAWNVYLLCSIARACARAGAGADAVAFLRAADALTDFTGATTPRYAAHPSLPVLCNGYASRPAAAHHSLPSYVEHAPGLRAHPRIRAEVIFTAGYLHEANGSLLAAESQYAACIALWPHHARALHHCADLSLHSAHAYSLGSGEGGDRRELGRDAMPATAPVTIADIRAVIDRARSYAVRALRIDPTDERNWNTYGRVLTMEGDSDGAARSQTRALKLHRQSPPVPAHCIPLIY